MFAVAEGWYGQGIKDLNDLDNYYQKYEKSKQIKKQVCKRISYIDDDNNKRQNLFNKICKNNDVIELKDIIKLINDSMADLYLSLHMNYLSDFSYYGSQVFYTENNDNNKYLAELLQTNFNKYFDFEKTSKKLSNDKYMFKRLDVNGVLIEYGFISSYKDRNNLKKESYKNELCEII